MGKIKIERIEVKNLFGYFTYDIKKDTLKSYDKLFLLYGDNGSGKTTILKTVFYLLSSQDDSGHKTELAKTKFEKVIVHLNNGISIGATREKRLIGTYTYEVKKSKTSIHKLILTTDETNRILLNPISKEGLYYEEILKFIASLNIKLFYLADTRKTMDAGVANLFQRDREDSMEFSTEVYDSKIIRKHRYNPEEIDPIEITIKALENWIRLRALTASKSGDSQTNTIYLDIVKQISKANFTGGDDLSSKIEEFKELLNEVNLRTENQAKYGLITKSEYSQISDSLEVLTIEKRDIIYNVLEPFIRGIKAKLDAQEKLQVLLSTLINQLNNFFSNKIISYSISTGFEIKQKHTNDKIEFRDLSSGEKQLLLLFSNTILASSQATIFIIDEPEISLNVKWQRKLLDTLLTFSDDDDGVQFLIATHSIELLNGRKDDVVKLTNENNLI